MNTTSKIIWTIIGGPIIWVFFPILWAYNVWIRSPKLEKETRLQEKFLATKIHTNMKQEAEINYLKTKLARSKKKPVKKKKRVKKK